MVIAIISVMCLLTLKFSSVQSEILWNSGDDGAVRWAFGCDYSSDGDFKNVRSTGPECGGKCLETEGCTHFTFTNNGEGGTCWLKRGNSKAYDHLFNLCGEVISESSLEWHSGANGRVRWARDCDYSSDGYINHTRSTPVQCAGKCLETEGCTRYSFNHSEGGTCWLKSGDSKAFGKSNSICGEVVSESAALYHRSDSGSIHFRCGGTIISEYFVLSAAHCFQKQEPSFVRLGTLNLLDLNKTDINIERTIKHPRFASNKNDIALIQLAQKIEFSRKILPACLRIDTSDIDSNVALTATGWGVIYEDGPVSQDLLKIDLYTVNLDKCRENWLRIDEGQYCAYNPGRDTCDGDSGGPLQLTKEYSLASIVGVVSFGKGCATESPGVYTRVAHYIDWIEDNVW